MSNDLNNNHHSFHYENGHGNGDEIVNLSSGFTDNRMDIVCHSVKKSKVSQGMSVTFTSKGLVVSRLNPIIQHPY